MKRQISSCSFYRRTIQCSTSYFFLTITHLSSISRICFLSRSRLRIEPRAKWPSRGFKQGIYHNVMWQEIVYLFSPICYSAILSIYFSLSIVSDGIFFFLVADTQLYNSLCPSVGPSVRRSVGPLVRPLVRNDRVEKWENAHFRPCPPVRNWWPCIRPCLSIHSSFIHSLLHWFSN